MPAPALALARRTVTLDTGNRKVEVPIDALGRERWRAKLDQRSVDRQDDDNTVGFRGHAAMFSKRTWIGPKRFGFWEQVAPGAFAKTINDGDVRFLINHDPSRLLARSRAGTLRLEQDGSGLAVDADLDRRQSYTNDVIISLERGDIAEMSFAWPPDAVKDSWETLEDGTESRTLLEVPLVDVSVVTYPAYGETDAGLRSAAFDVLCRSAGLDDEAQDRLLQRIADQIAEGEPSTETPEPGSSTRAAVSQPGSSTGAPPEHVNARSRRLALLAAKYRLPKE